MMRPWTMSARFIVMLLEFDSYGAGILLVIALSFTLTISFANALQHHSS